MRSSFWAYSGVVVAASAVALVTFGTVKAGLVPAHPKPPFRIVAAHPPQTVDDPALVAALTRGGPPVRDLIHREKSRRSLPVAPLRPARPALSDTGPTADDLDGIKNSATAATATSPVANGPTAPSSGTTDIPVGQGQ